MRSQRLSAGTVALLVALGGPAFSAEQQWVKLKSANFELYTTAGEKKGRQAIVYFEQVRDFFQKVTPGKKRYTQPVKIIGFRSEKEFRSYRPSEGNAAFYLPGPGCDYIVMQSISEQFYPVAIHEYTHLLVQASGGELPLWLSEGLADLYSTLKPYGGGMMIGDLIPGRLMLLLESKWLDVEALTSVGRDSPYYNEKDRAGVFYAQSWALTHMLNLAEAYQPKFREFLRMIAAGSDAKTAFWLVYAKTPAQVQKDLQAYLRGDRFRGFVFKTQLAKSVEQPEIRPATALEAGLLLADLLARTTGKEGEARAAYEKVLGQNPQSWEAEQALAYLLWRSGQEDEARNHFDRAAKLGSTTAKMYHDYAALGPVSGKDSDRLELLRKAVELQPDYRDARHYLGISLLEAEQYQEAREQLLQAQPAPAERASEYFRALAYASYRLGLKEEAKMAARAAVDHAKTPEEREQVEKFARFLEEEERAAALAAAKEAAEKQAAQAADVAAHSVERAEPSEGGSEARPRLDRRAGEDARGGRDSGRILLRRKEDLQVVEGLLVQVDCLGDTARVWIQSGEEKVALATGGGGSVLVLRSGRSISHDFQCGPQKPQRVVVH